MSKVLCLRTCKLDGTSLSSDAKGFVWPLSVGEVVTAPDWDPSPQCGHGLHGHLWGEGTPQTFEWRGAWLVVEVESDTVVDLDGKVKFPSCVIVHSGDQASATSYLYEHGATGRSVIGGTATAGDGGTATAGDSGTATAGYRGTATAGDRGTIMIRWYDEDAERYRIVVGHVGEHGIKPNCKYKLDDSHKFVEAT